MAAPMSHPCEVRIAGRRIAADEPPFIIAELSANHLGDIDRALTSIDVAAQAGADAVKLQTYTPDTITIDSEKPFFRIDRGPWAGQTLYSLYASAFTPYEWHGRLFDAIRARGMIPLSTPFDQTAIDLLASLDAPAYKVASFEVTDLPLIAAMAVRGRPLIVSTGMANLGEIEEAVGAARRAGCREIVLLHCTSGYPTPFSDANLQTIPHLGAAFGAVPGLSDHTPGSSAAVAAIALGARVIEKHFTLSRADGGPDAAFSLEPDELKALVRDCRSAWEALGRISYDLADSERGNVMFRRSLFVVEDVRAGEAFTAANVRSIRPGHGIAPKHLPAILGRPSRRDIERGEPLCWSMIDA